MKQTTLQPLYIGLADQLSVLIRQQSYPTGTRLPSEDELARQFSVSRHTVREALRRLRNLGLIEARKGSGTIVLDPTKRVAYVHRIASINDLMDYASNVRLRVRDCEIVTAGPTLARRLDCALHQTWCRISGVRHVLDQERSECWTEVYLHQNFSDYCQALTSTSEPPYPIYEWIERQHGVAITHIDQLITVGTVSQRVAKQLLVAPGSPAVVVRRTYRLSTGEVAEVAINVHPASDFHYSLKIHRPR